MKLANCFLVIVLWLLTLLSGQGSFAQPTSEIGKKSHYIQKLVDRHHYSGTAFDDSLSINIFTLFIEEIDPAGMYFYQSDIDSLKEAFEYRLDNEIKQSTSAFFDATARIFEKRLIESEAIITALSEEKMNWKADEVLSYAEGDYPDYVNSKLEMKERWRKWYKSTLLETLFSGDFHSNPYQTTIDSVLAYEDEAKELVVESEKYEVKSYLENPTGYKNHLSTFYLDAIAHSLDPHTTYFSADEQSDFVEDLSGDNYAFGIFLEENEKGEIILEHITPGSPAWLSNDLNTGDIIRKIKLGDGKLLDLSVSGMDEIRLMFEESDEETLYMQVKKKNGQLIDVTLEKGKIYDDEDVIKSVILKGEQKIGYITLPDFYTNWDGYSSKGCANDVAKMIVKLNKESMDGLILDLRNNGGGSVKEAIDLAGMFINYGPISIVNEKSSDPKSIKDFNKGSVFNGPLVILVNGLSASASEIFTAAMQDYNRAIVVGSGTFGKSTGQVIMPLDPAYGVTVFDQNAVDESLGYLKVTTSKYYRITRGTHQLKGITPDVPLPDIYDIYDYKEVSYQNALPNDSVDKKVYYTAFEDFPVSSLKSNSGQRLENTTYWKQIPELVDSIEHVYNNLESIPLHIETYQTIFAEYEKMIDRLLESIENPSDAFEVTNNQYDLEIMKINEYRSELNEEYLERLRNDVYIDEAYKILNDYIRLKSNN